MCEELSTDFQNGLNGNRRVREVNPFNPIPESVDSLPHPPDLGC
jgi:hypothetical protein